MSRSEEWTRIRVRKETAEVLQAMHLKNYDVAIEFLLGRLEFISLISRGELPISEESDIMDWLKRGRPR